MLFRYKLNLVMLLSGLLVFLVVAAASHTYYVATNGGNGNSGASAAPFATFAKAFSVMSAGDTLLLKDGIYSERLVDMPSGTDGHYTNIKAEHNFRVTVRAGNALLIYKKSYVRIEGIKFDGNLTNGDCADLEESDHLKIIRCSFTGSEAVYYNNVVTFCITANCSYILVEDCWAFGTGRYKFLSFTSNNVIFRRCVARHDYHPITQCANFHRYSSTNVEFQNCLAINSGLHDQSNGHLYAGIFNDNHDPNTDNTGKNLGCIMLNLHDGCPIYDIRIWGTRTVENCVIWDCNNGMDFSNYKDGVTPFSPSNAYVNHCTIGGLIGTSSDWSGGYGIFDEMAPFGAPMEVSSVKNSIITQASDALNAIKTSDYNCFYGNATNYTNAPAGPHDNTINPGLLYITRAAAGAGNASDSGYRGATIEKRYGVDESLWGEAGYETLTGVNLWPWPNEAEIKADMSSWNAQLTDHGYTSVGVLGTRGFCAPGNGLYGGPMTLTSYIWEYLGNPCPPEICPGSTKTELSVPEAGISLYCSPNPFNSNTDITISVPRLGSGTVGRKASGVKVEIFNAKGRLVHSFPSLRFTPDTRRITLQWNAGGMPSGIYLARLRIGSVVRQQKLILTK
jgi:hypothetical protein